MNVHTRAVTSIAVATLLLSVGGAAADAAGLANAPQSLSTSQSPMADTPEPGDQPDVAGAPDLPEPGDIPDAPGQ